MTIDELITNLKDIKEEIGGGMPVAFVKDTGPVEVDSVFVSKSSDGVGIYVELAK